MTSSIGTNAGTGNGELYTNAVNTAAKWGDTVGAGSTVGFDVPVNFSVATSKFTVNASTGAATFAGAVSGITSLTASGALSLTGSIQHNVLQDSTIYWTSNGTSAGTIRGGMYVSGAGSLLLQVGPTPTTVATLSSTGLAVTGSITQSSLAGGGRRALYCDNNGVIGV